VFHVSPPPRFAVVEGGQRGILPLVSAISPTFLHILSSGHLYIDFLGQAERQETKMDGSGGSSLKRDRVAWPGLGPMSPGLFWASWPPSLTSCAPGVSRGNILLPEKFQANLNLRRSLKRKNTQNRVFMFCRVITKIRGTNRKSS
jgi:hypothetical protein